MLQVRDHRSRLEERTGNLGSRWRGDDVRLQGESQPARRFGRTFSAADERKLNEIARQDGGKSFKFDDSADDIPGNLYSVKFFEKTGFVLGSDGVLLRYTSA